MRAHMFLIGPFFERRPLIGGNVCVCYIPGVIQDRGLLKGYTRMLAIDWRKMTSDVTSCVFFAPHYPLLSVRACFVEQN